MPAITLENGNLRAVIDPGRGAGVMALFSKKDGSWLPLMPDARDKESELKSACFLMIPYSNRIEDGSFSFEGRKYQLANGEKHAIHGDTRHRAWSVEAVTSSSICCSFASTTHAGINWPWPFEARVEYSLMDTVFSSHLILWNRGDTPMPAGFGWHPYFSRKLTRDGEPVYLLLKTTGAYPDANDNRIPSGPPGPLTVEHDFSTEEILQADCFLDACFQGYDGNGHIAWPKSGIKVTFKCSPICTHLVIYNPPAPYFAVEPVTNANNGVNLYAGGMPGSGVVSLSPGESLEGIFELRMEFNKKREALLRRASAKHAPRYDTGTRKSKENITTEDTEFTEK